MNSVFIIAEAGVNHNGDINVAKQLIDIALESGADAVKFQTFKARNLVTKNAPKAEYQLKATDSLESQFEMIRRLELDLCDHETLIAHCADRGIKFLSTPFDSESLRLLIDLGIDTLKIPSGEATNLPFLRQIGRAGKQILLSTGMCNLGEIESAIVTLTEAGTPFEHITVLHTNTEYPTPMKDVNLMAMKNIARAFGVKVGYSDHTLGIEVPIAAVALGAVVIEKHFTLDQNMDGPDHKASMEPQELRAMVSAIRNIEVALGDGVKRVSESERRNIAIARKSIIASTRIHKGELFSESNLATKRPGTGVSPMRWDELLGKPSPRNFDEDDIIQL